MVNTKDGFNQYLVSLKKQTRLDIIKHYEDNKCIDAMIRKGFVDLYCYKFDVHLLYKCLFVILVGISVLIN